MANRACGPLVLEVLVIGLSTITISACGGGGSNGGTTGPPPPPVPFSWVWVSGSNQVNAKPVYGSQGTPSTTNVPGARTNAVAWTDSAGNLWLFGGVGVDSQGNSNVLNDLWEYNPSTNMWVWVSGSKVVGAAGVYGSQGTPSTTNVPGARTRAISWSDSAGTLWLFGGAGIDSQDVNDLLNDLWEYNPSTNMWVWVSGSAVRDAAGVYGSQGTPSTTNVPGARELGVSWIDPAGNLWLFGGFGVDSLGSAGDLNDLWEYSPGAKTWIWVSGLSQVNTSAVYGTKGTPSTSNMPGARQEAVSWIDSAGNLWLFGGGGDALAGSVGVLNDFWEYNPSANTWVWVSGSNEPWARSVYGSKGATAPSVVPGARQDAVAWTDSAGNLWLFGGYGVDSLGGDGDYDDLWEFPLK